MILHIMMLRKSIKKVSVGGPIVPNNACRIDEIVKVYGFSQQDTSGECSQ